MPKSWDGYNIQYRYKSNLYNIKISRKTMESNKREIYMNGEKIEKDYIDLKDDKKIENIEIKM